MLTSWKFYGQSKLGKGVQRFVRFVLEILNSEREIDSPVINKGLNKRQLENNASQIT